MTAIAAAGTMRALVVGQGGELHVDRRPIPGPLSADQVLVQVHGAALNRADLFQRLGQYPAPAGSPQEIPGVEFAGMVSATGPDVADLAVGDRVYGIVGGGAQAEFVLTVASHLCRVPDRLGLVEAAAVPEVFLTAQDSLFTQAQARPGEVVLIHAVGSGVGTAAVQLAHAAGCVTVGTSRTTGKLERARALGLETGILVDSAMDARGLAAAIRGASPPVDVALELIGGWYVQVDTLVAAYRGRIVLIGRHMAGSVAEVDLHDVMPKRLQLIGTVFRGRTSDEKAAALRSFGERVGRLLERGVVKPVIAEVIPFEKAEAAYQLLESDTTFGKVVLEMPIARA